MRWRLLFSTVLALLAGFVVGNITPVRAATSYFAGYNYNASSAIGVLARLPYGNPNVPVSGFSTEWALAGGASSYIQAGWLKNMGDSAPSYFVEYWNGCGSSCRFYYGSIDSNIHEYKVQRSGSNWCGYIDGAQKACVSTSQLGFTTTSNEQYFGETINTAIQLGGTGASHFRMSRLSTENSSGSWTQVNTNNLSIYVSPGTSYHASKGFTSPDTWEDNWTQ